MKTDAHLKTGLSNLAGPESARGTLEIKYRVRGLNPSAADARPLDSLITQLTKQITVSSALVILEHNPDTAPPFCVAVDLAVPGPDIHASARDHTLEAALLKVGRRLEEQILARKNRVQVRQKGHDRCHRKHL